MTDEIVYLGCYTAESGGAGEGIVAASRDPETGRLEPLGVVAHTPSPSFLTWHPTLPVLYAANEGAAGAVSGWAVDGDTLAPRGSAETGGGSPCHLAVTGDGRHLVTTNYATGSVAVHPLDPETGAVGERTDLIVHDGHGPDSGRQEGPHPHMVSTDPAGDGLHVVDLGTDGLYPYRVDGGRLMPVGDPVRVAPGTGPRHVARQPDGRRAYVVGELDGMVTAFDVDERGWHQRHRVEASIRPGDKFPSEVALAGHFLYVATRGVDTVSVFAVDGAAPRLVAEVDSGGKWPRHFALIGDHLYVANQLGGSVAVFAVDRASGTLTPVDQPVAVGSPTCVLRPQPTGMSG